MTIIIIIIIFISSFGTNNVVHPSLTTYSTQFKLISDPKW